MVPSEVLSDVIKRIVEAVRPKRIILFGSMARGEAGPDSDLDLLVVRDGETNPRETAKEIYRHLLGVKMQVDVLVISSEDLEQYRDRPGGIIMPALREGRDVYVAS